MDDPRLDEILERLDDIESALHDHLQHHGSRERHGRQCRRRSETSDERGCGQPFEEKRVVDLIVRLVSKRVEEVLESHLAKPAADTEGASAQAPAGKNEGGRSSG